MGTGMGKKKAKKLLCKLGLHKRCIFSQDGWNFVFCLRCKKRWHALDI